MKTIITVLDDISETSMPFNEFVLYRSNHYHDEKQILIICGARGNLPKVVIPETLDIKYAGRKLSNIRKTIIETTEELKRLNTPYVIHMHQVQSGFLAEMAMLGTGFRKKVLFTVHSTFSGYKFHNKVLSFINTLLAQRTTCVSNASYQDYPEIIKQIKHDRIQALQNGVDTERIDKAIPVTHNRIPTGINFIYVARLVPIKNHKFLVDVLSRCDEKIYFTFVGAEDKEQEVRRKAKDLGVEDRISFTGLIPRNDVFALLQEADYYISSSTLEGLPVSVLEAMYCGLPCLLSDIPQHREVAGDRAIFLPFDIEKWATEINRIAELPTEERQKISQQIRSYVKDNFSLEAMHKKYDAVYELL
ncbi:MAG: glycosyltransferase family 4 protein [Eubacterium sp.]|nr:glycosyltransferase family 4 protein [Eubacterium sp.]